MLQSLTTAKTRELREKHPKFFGQAFDDKVTAKYKLAGLPIKKLEFLENHLHTYLDLEKKALIEHESPFPTNYLSEAKRLSIPKRDRETGAETYFWDYYDEGILQVDKHPFMKGFMKRLIEAREDLEILKKEKEKEGYVNYVDVLNVIDIIYDHIVSRINKSSPPCRAYICGKLYDAAIVRLFHPQNKVHLNKFLLNEIILKHYRFVLPTVSRKTGYALKRFFIRSSNAGKREPFINEIKETIKYCTEVFIPAYEASAKQFGQFEEAEVINRVKERLSEREKKKANKKKIKKVR